MRVAGIDIGSRFIKLVLIEKGKTVFFKKTEASFNPLENCFELFKDIRADTIIATGYGRHLLETHNDIKTITEIKAFAIGAKAIFPKCRTIIDIGGQDTKVISLNEKGIVKKFEMNDRCAAGTGKFLEIMAKVLGYKIEEFGSGSANNCKEIQISSMCTVFAESEVISLISKGVSRKDITVAIHRAIANKVVGLLKRIPIEDDIVFAGGCANSHCLKKMLEQSIGKTLKIPSVPELTGALGAALYAEQGVSPVGIGRNALNFYNEGVENYESWCKESVNR